MMTWPPSRAPVHAPEGRFDRETARDAVDHEWHRRVAAHEGRRGAPSHLVARVAYLVIRATNEVGIAEVTAVEIANFLHIDPRTVYSALVELDGWGLWTRDRRSFVMQVGRRFDNVCQPANDDGREGLARGGKWD